MTGALPAPARAETDVLVIGGGIAGFQAAIAARKAGWRVTLAHLARGASTYVIAANVPLGHADPADSPRAFADDMVAAGCGLNDRRLVTAMAERSVAAFRDLAALGVPFAADRDRFRQRHLSGNRYPRSVYVPEGTGRTILDHLARHARAIGVEMLAGWRAVDLLRSADGVGGALIADRAAPALLAVHARATVLAAGGIGRLYDDSTYPADVACASYALALDAGATLIDMEFVQFEPTVTVHPAGCRGMEMPTAMLGDGAALLNAAGERFMFRHNPEHGEKRIEKARMSLCIQREIDEGRGLPDGTVHFDATRLPPDKLESYVSHCRRLRQSGLDPAREMPRVRPAAHSEMGGILIDAAGRTGIPGLYAVGEAAGGIHGASRLAGNGGGETLVFGVLVGEGVAADLSAGTAGTARIDAAAALARLDSMRAGAGALTADEAKALLRAAMGAGVGLYRDAAGLAAALAEIAAVEGELARGLSAHGLDDALSCIEARNMTLSARLIASAALARTESRGAHQRTDHPERDDGSWSKHLGCRRSPSGSATMFDVPVH
ncbi:MAG: FAD-binding protein [Alphaproteobacteria bacterium]